MTTTTRPHGMRAELRDWYYDEELYAWYGFVYGDVDEVFTNGQPVKFPSREVKEVNKYKDVTIVEMNSGSRFFMLDATEFKKPTGPANE